MSIHFDFRRVNSDSALALDQRLREALRNPDITTDVRLGTVAFTLDVGQIIGITDVIVGVVSLAHDIWHVRREGRDAVQRIAEEAVPRRAGIREPEVNVQRRTSGTVVINVSVESQQAVPVDVTIDVRSHSVRVQITPLR